MRGLGQARPRGAEAHLQGGSRVDRTREMCIHRIHGREDARIVAAGDPNTEKKERQAHANPSRIAVRHTNSGRNTDQERTAVDGRNEDV